MSKLSASEFQTWDSLYWPDRIPRTSQLPDSPPSAAIPGQGAAWEYRSGAYSVSWQRFSDTVDSVVDSVKQRGQSGPLAVLGSDPLLVLAGLTFSLKTGTSIEIVNDPSKTTGTCATGIDHTGKTGDPERGIEVKAIEGNASAWEPPDPSVSILFPEDVRVIYPLRELRDAVESFLSFTDLRRERCVALMGSVRREFGMFVAVSTLFSGVPLVMIDDVRDVEKVSSVQPSVLFLGRDSDGSHAGSSEKYSAALGHIRRSFSFLGVEGPSGPEFTRSLEKATNIPVLQMYGISGRGILFSNPREFNVHGSVGIPVTNVEAVIADNLEGNWTRDRILMGPGMEGELVVRGAFVDAMKDVGDARQNPVRTSILGQSTDWVTTGVVGKMDENGYFYLKDASFR